MRTHVALVFLLAWAFSTFHEAARAASPETKGFKGWSWIGPKRRSSHYSLVTPEQGPVRSGKHSERFQIHSGDCGKVGNYDTCAHDREHIAWNETGSTRLDSPVWYSFSVYRSAETPAVIGQVNVILAEFRPVGPGQINLSLELQGGQLVAVVGNTKVQQRNDMKPPPIEQWSPVTSFLPDKWYDFTLEAVWSRTKKGKLRLYLEDRLVVSHDGPNTAFAKRVHMQYGVYRPFVSKAGKSLPDQTFYFDRVGKASSREALPD